MIAFSRDALKSRDQPRPPILIVGPQIQLKQENNAKDAGDASKSVSESFAREVAKQQQEMAMLHRALVRCGLVGNDKSNNKE